MLVAIEAASAQTAASTDANGRTALLQVGPQARRGIDALAPDATPYWYGVYGVGDARVELLYIATPLERAASWPIATCALVSLRSNGGYTYYASSRGWSMLVRVIHGDFTAGVTLCTFVNAFVTDQRFFETLSPAANPGDAPIFPAVIEL